MDDMKQDESEQNNNRRGMILHDSLAKFALLESNRINLTTVWLLQSLMVPFYQVRICE
jgi:hypothetical protein